MSKTPEQRARREIDANLNAAGWTVQDRQDLDLTAGRDIAVLEFAMNPGFGFADYLLYLDCKATGAVALPALSRKRYSIIHVRESRQRE
jgi:type I restriction enzyme, R subunit